MMEKQNRGKAKTKADGKRHKDNKNNPAPLRNFFSLKKRVSKSSIHGSSPIQKLIQGWIT